MSLDTNIKAYYKCDESSGNIADSLGLNNLTNIGVATFGTGIINNGIILNGSSQYFTIADALQTGLDLSPDLTFALWVKFAGFGSNDGNANAFIYKRGASGTNQEQYRFFYESDSGGTNHIYLSTSSDGSSSSQQKIDYTFSTGTWYHVAVTKSGTTVKFYVNGSEVTTGASGSVTSTIFDGVGNFYLGTNQGVTGYLNGRMDEIYISSDAKSAGDISDLYNGGAGRSYPFTTPATPGLLAIL